ncbi:MAG: chemotaxis protein CheA [Kiritimatiellae bacterium]|nr:chemotaxis protein CheA [Kiritimatiellia bacterium]
MEKLCEDLILAEPDNHGLLGRVHGELEHVADWAATAGLDDVQAGAAAAAGMLQEILAGSASDPAGNLDVVARAGATIQAIVCDGRSAAETPFPPELRTGATASAGEPSGRAPAPALDVDKDLLEAFISEANEHLSAAEEHLLALESSPASQEDIHAIFRAFHTIKGAAAFLNFDEIRLLAHEMESVLEQARNGQLILADVSMDVLLRATDGLRRRVNSLGTAAAQAATAAPETELQEILANVRAVTAGPSAVKPEPGVRAPEERGGPAARPGAAIREAVKVDADRLDRLLDTIGELVIAESMISQSQELKRFASPELERQARQLDKITRSLQQMSTSLRLVPVRPVFLRMARLVRDLARRAHKPIEFSMSGEDTEIDKAVVDRLADPLVHLLRNAVDHGIEEAPARRRAGKPETGHIGLRAFHRGGNIYVEVEDDGRGFNREAILAKAIEQGLTTPGVSLSDQEVYGFVFQPGFSTTNTVTDISGRGVGLDVVKRYVESLRGQIDVQSDPGRRCVVGMRLPLTLAIVDGMVVRVGNERYIAPTLSIVRSLRPAEDDYSTVVGRGEMLKTEGRLIPLFRLARLFEVAGAGQNINEGLVVVVEDNGQQVGLLVDELQGQQQIVIKGFGEHLRDVLGISGGAIMPDGSVGLILDVGGLVKLAHSPSPDRLQGIGVSATSNTESPA